MPTEPTLTELLLLLRRATTPEEIFGPLASDMAAALKQRYRELALALHPDYHPQHTAEAAEAFIRLQSWHSLARRKLEQGGYGAGPQFSVRTPRRHYQSVGAPLSGDLCDLWPADADGAMVLLKVARHLRNNDLLNAEVQALRRLAQELEGQPVRAHFPTLVEALTLRDEAGVARRANVLRAEREYVSLAEVIAAYPQGIEAADAAWMFNRMLTALGLAHNLGLVHGAVLPPHVLIRLGDHNGMLIDWCYSVPIGTALKAISPPYAADYPPEVQARQPATPATDLYMAARCMVRLLGGQGDAASLPPLVPRPVRSLLSACLIAAPQRRAADAWALFDDFRTVLGDLYGPPRFRPFRMPVVTPGR